MSGVPLPMFWVFANGARIACGFEEDASYETQHLYLGQKKL